MTAKVFRERVSADLNPIRCVPPFDRSDVVGERKNGFRVALVPLHRDLDRDAFPFPREIDDVGMDRRLGAIQMLDERDDSALEEEFVTAPLPLVG